jgi:hypothetical protein
MVFEAQILIKAEVLALINYRCSSFTFLLKSKHFDFFQQNWSR